MSIRHAVKLVNASKLNLLPSSSQISIIPLSSSSFGSKFLQQFNRNQIHVIRTFNTRNIRGPTSSHQQTMYALGNLIIQKSYLWIFNNSKKFIVFNLCLKYGIYHYERSSLVHQHVYEALKAEPIEFDEFLTRILPTGEVAITIVYCQRKKRLIAQLHRDALINGKSYTNNVITIKTGRFPLSHSDVVFNKIRNAEEKLGLPFRERIPIDVAREVPPLVMAICFIYDVVFFAYFVRRFSLIRR